MRRLLVVVSFLWGCASLEAGEGAWFENAAGRAGIGGVKTLRCRFADIDGDRWPDVVLGTDRVYRNEPREAGPGGRGFEDVTERAGFERIFRSDEGRGPASFCLAGDVDNDGDVDLFVARNCEPEKPAQGPGRNLPAEKEGRMVVDWKDPGVRSAILLNDGRGRFSALPYAGVAEPAETTCAAVFVDVDADGLLDLFTGNWYVSYGWSYEAYPDRLFKGVGGGRFVETTSRAGLFTVRRPGYRNSSRPTYGVAHCDWNNDGRQDLLVCAYGRRWNNLWRNDGDGTFTEVGFETGFDGDAARSGAYPEGIRRSKEAPFRANGNTFSAAPADFDNDGDIDVYIGEITHWWAGPSSDRSELLVNQGAKEGWSFSREGEARGIVREHATGRWNQGDLHVGWLDADNDGLLDLVIASSDYPDDQFLRLFRQDEDHRFEDVTSLAGFDWRNPTGMSFGDFDRDGRTDILLGNNNMRLTKEQKKGRVLEAALFRNVAGTGNHFLTVSLAGKGEGASNRLGIGARVEVRAGGRVQVREIRGGGGHCGQQDEPVAHFGLGPADRVETLRVRWPDREGTVQVFTNVEADAFVLVREGDDTLEILRRVPRAGGEGGEEGF